LFRRIFVNAIKGYKHCINLLAKSKSLSVITAFSTEIVSLLATVDYFENSKWQTV
jgi:hypothetical protein